MALNSDAQEILIAGVDIANALSDGVQLSDIGALMKLPGAIAGWDEGITNLKETASTPEGRQEIEDLLVEEFDIPDDELENKIEKTLAWLNATYDLYETWSEPDEDEEEPAS